jgi:hypothetical protein
MVTSERISATDDRAIARDGDATVKDAKEIDATAVADRVISDRRCLLRC